MCIRDSVSASVVVIKARAREASSAGGGFLNFGETGAGVLISAAGKVITASHVVQASPMTGGQQARSLSVRAGGRIAETARRRP